MNANVKERAKYVGRKIRRLIREGKFILGHGYLQYSKKACFGCALAAAARALNTEKKIVDLGGRLDGDGCVVAVLPKITANDAAQLEMGFEYWDETVQTTKRLNKKTGNYYRQFKANPKNPFHQLGAELREERDRREGVIGSTLGAT